MIALARVDNRLIHGQIVEVWLSALKVQRILVADDAAAANPLLRTAMGIAVPPPLAVEINAIKSVDYSQAQAVSERVLLLLRDVSDVLRACELGLVLSVLNLGNIHYSPGRTQITPSVFLSLSEIEQLRQLVGRGITVEACAVPREKPVSFPEIESRFCAGCCGS